MSGFAERSTSQNRSAISTARTSDSFTETEGTASSNSPSSFSVEDTTTSVGKVDIVNKTLQLRGTPHTRDNTLSTLLETHRTWSIRSQNVNGITQRFKNNAKVLHLLNYPKNGFQKLHTHGAANLLRFFYLPHTAKNIGDLSWTLTTIRKEKEQEFWQNSSSSHISAHFATLTYVIPNFYRYKNVPISCRGGTIRKKQQLFTEAHEKTAWLTSFTYIYLCTWRPELNWLNQQNGRGRKLASVPIFCQ